VLSCLDGGWRVSARITAPQDVEHSATITVISSDNVRLFEELGKLASFPVTLQGGDSHALPEDSA
jgi:hypothetical protein